MVIEHAGIIGKWNNFQNFTYAKVLILGSFNPYNPNGDNTDFYYGRCSNYLWKAIAEIQGFYSTLYCNNLNAKLQLMSIKKFCFLDLIKSIKVESENNDYSIVNQFVNNEIFNGFSDSKLFTTKTNIQNHNIIVSLSFNEQIIQIFNDNSINTVIHTLGNSTIDENFIGLKQKRLGINGINGFVNFLKESCPNVNFIGQSYSPSQFAVNRGGVQYYRNLKIWLNSHLNLV